MNMGRLLAIVYGMLGLVIALTMGLNIQTANATLQAANITNLTGMSVMDDWGAALIILGLLTLSGTFIYGGVSGKLQATGIADLLWTVGAAIGAVIGLTLMSNIITAANNLIGAVTTDAEDVIWGVIPLLAYGAIIAGAGWRAGKNVGDIVKSRRAARRSKKSAGF